MPYANPADRRAFEKARAQRRRATEQAGATSADDICALRAERDRLAMQVEDLLAINLRLVGLLEIASARNGASMVEPVGVDGVDPPRVHPASTPTSEPTPPETRDDDDDDGRSTGPKRDPIESIFAAAPDTHAQASELTRMLRSLDVGLARAKDVALEDIAREVVAGVAGRKVRGLVDYARTIASPLFGSGVLAKRRSDRQSAAPTVTKAEQARAKKADVDQQARAEDAERRKAKPPESLSTLVERLKAKGPVAPFLNEQAKKASTG